MKIIKLSANQKNTPTVLQAGYSCSTSCSTSCSDTKSILIGVGSAILGAGVAYLYFELYQPTIK
ncbi:MAG: hypothetical protein K2Q03_01245 [Sphingobacteriaceae bacterium]|nr:hypothetical protein [Sphingobacteriaceae bacterium]